MARHVAPSGFGSSADVNINLLKKSSREQLAGWAGGNIHSPCMLRNVTEVFRLGQVFARHKQRKKNDMTYGTWDVREGSMK
jgi:hypothetical protein